MSSSPRHVALQRLHNELMALKQAHHHVHLEKTGSPFPVLISCRVDRPAAAHHYDVDDLHLLLTLTDDRALHGDRRAVTISVLNESLPKRLRSHIASQLSSHYTSTSSTSSLSDTLHLGSILAYTQSTFGQLISSLPDCIESYQSVDEHGATVRRFALLADVAPPPEAKDGLESAGASSTERHLDDPSELLDHGVHAMLANELTLLAKRYPPLQLILTDAHHVSLDPTMTSTFTPPTTASSSPHNDGGGAWIKFIFRFTPTDPEWERELVVIEGAASIAGNGLVMAVVGPLSMPLIMRQNLSRALQEEYQGHRGERNALRRAIARIENHAAQLARREMEDGDGEEEDGEGEEDGGKEESGDEEESEEEEDTSGDGGADFHSSTPTTTTTTQPSTVEANLLTSLRVQLQGLKLDGMDVVEPQQLSLQASCTKCSASLVLPLNGDVTGHKDARTGWFDATPHPCPHCSSMVSASFVPKMAHDTSNQIALVKVNGCRAIDLVLPSVWMAQCSKCGGASALRDLLPGHVTERPCRTCHVKMGLSFQSVSFIPPRLAQPSNNSIMSNPSSSLLLHTSSTKHQKRVTVFDQPVTPGQPLPYLGTCPHYRHSHRWLRFPCCGRRFPCDLCHEELTPDGHDVKWALRMTCGFCSIEQPVAAVCAHCDKHVATSASRPRGGNSRFWEGGLGCRDTKRMNRNDPHKYRNSKAKTKCKKSERVGPKADKERGDKDKDRGGGEKDRDRGGGGDKHASASA